MTYGGILGGIIKEVVMALRFATDIRPLFREGDIECMTPMGDCAG